MMMMMMMIFALFTGWSNEFQRDPQTYGNVRHKGLESVFSLHRLSADVKRGSDSPRVARARERSPTVRYRQAV